MHIFLPFTDALHSDREKFQTYYCVHLKIQNREKEVLKKNGIRKYYHHI